MQWFKNALTSARERPALLLVVVPLAFALSRLLSSHFPLAFFTDFLVEALVVWALIALPLSQALLIAVAMLVLVFALPYQGIYGLTAPILSVAAAFVYRYYPRGEIVWLVLALLSSLGWLLLFLGVDSAYFDKQLEVSATTFHDIASKMSDEDIAQMQNVFRILHVIVGGYDLRAVNLGDSESITHFLRPLFFIDMGLRLMWHGFLTWMLGLWLLRLQEPTTKGLTPEVFLVSRVLVVGFVLFLLLFRLFMPAPYNVMASVLVVALWALWVQSLVGRLWRRSQSGKSGGFAYASLYFSFGYIASFFGALLAWIPVLWLLIVPLRPKKKEDIAPHTPTDDALADDSPKDSAS